MPVDLDPIVARQIEIFNRSRVQTIERIEVLDLLKNKNPYLFIALRGASPLELAHSLVRATISSSEETVFGQTLENIAIDVCESAFGGQKSTTTGIDLDFSRNGRRYLVSIKSGPKWGNSSQKAKMKEDFRRALQVARQGGRDRDVEAIEGCCYGTQSREYGTYRKVCGADFWELISGEDDLFRRLIDSMLDAAANTHDVDLQAPTEKVAKQLTDHWCNGDGEVDWPRIVALNSVPVTAEGIRAYWDELETYLKDAEHEDIDLRARKASPNARIIPIEGVPIGHAHLALTVERKAREPGVLPACYVRLALPRDHAQYYWKELTARRTEVDEIRGIRWVQPEQSRSRYLETGRTHHVNVRDLWNEDFTWVQETLQRFRAVLGPLVTEVKEARE